MAWDEMALIPVVTSSVLLTALEVYTNHRWCAVEIELYTGNSKHISVICSPYIFNSLQWRNNERDGVSNHRRLYYLLNCWFRCRSKKTSKFRVPAQKASKAENVSLWRRHHIVAGTKWLQFCVEYNYQNDNGHWRCELINSVLTSTELPTSFRYSASIENIHAAPVPYLTMYHSEQKCAYSCSEWCIVGYETGVLWD